MQVLMPLFFKVMNFEKTIGPEQRTRSTGTNTSRPCQCRLERLVDGSSPLLT